MVLRVPFSEFSGAVRRLLPKPEAYLEVVEGLVRLSAGSPGSGTVIECAVALPSGEVRDQLKSEGLEIFDGAWSLSERAFPTVSSTENLPAHFHVAAIAYVSRDKGPGLWVDAFPGEVSGVQALRAMYDELMANGEVSAISFEQFVNYSQANVLVIGPDQLAEWCHAKAVSEPPA